MSVDLSVIRSALGVRLRNRRLVRDGTLLLLASGIGTGLALIRTPLLTWLLPKEAIGMLGVVTSWTVFLALLTWPSSLPIAAYHFMTKGVPGAFRAALGNQLRRAPWSVLGYLACSAYWLSQGHSSLAALFVVAGAAYPFVIVLASSANAYAARQDFASVFWYRIAYSGSLFAGFAIALFPRSSPYRSIVLYLLLNQLALSLLHVILTVKGLRRFERIGDSPMPARDRRDLFDYGRRLTGIHVTGTLLSRVDQLLVSVVAPLTAVADYTIALLAQGQFRRLWGIYSQLRYPKLMEVDSALRVRRFLIECVVGVVGFAGVALCAAVAAQLLVPRLLPPSYADGLPFIQCLLAASALGVPGNYADLSFQLEQNARDQSILRIATGIVQVVASVTLVLTLGAFGGALSRAVGSAAFSTIGIALVVRRRRGARASAA
jgi:O-antigen/teichoic acid export membrane protein